MKDLRTLSAVTLAVLGLSLSLVPASATPIPGIDAPLAGSDVQNGYGSGSKGNFGTVKMRKKGAFLTPGK